MAKQLYIGASTGTFRTKKGKQFLIVKDKAYAFDPADIKGYEDWFLTADEYVERLDNKRVFRRGLGVVEQMTAAPGETREVTPPKPATKKRTTKTTTEK